MSFWFNLLQLSVIFAILNQAVGSNVTVESVPCMNNEGSEMCKFCVSSLDESQQPVESPPAKVLQSYLDYQQIKVNHTKGFVWLYWDYNNESVSLANYINFTVYLRQTGENGTGFPMPGCCEVPLHEKKCKPEESFFGEVFYGINLLGFSMIRYYTYYSQDEYFKDYDRFAVLQPPLTPEFHFPPEAWLNYTREKVIDKYSYVCLFQMPKFILTALNGSLVSGPNDLESYLFKRDVYIVDGFSYVNNKLYNKVINHEYKCTSKSFNSTDLFNISSSSNSNLTFTCMLLWFTIGNSTGPEVTCMPHNATYIDAPPTKKDELDAVSIIIIVVIVIASLLVCIIIVVFCIRCRKKVNDFIKSTKEVSSTVQQTMNLNENASDNLKEVNFEEKFIVFNEAERSDLGTHYQNIKTISNGSYDVIKYGNPLKLQIDSKRNEIPMDDGKVSNIYLPKTLNTGETSFEDIHEVNKNFDRKNGSSDDSGMGSQSSPLSDVSGHVGNESIYNQVFDEACRNSSIHENNTRSPRHLPPIGDVSNSSTTDDSGLASPTLPPSPLSSSSNFTSANVASNSTVSGDSGISSPPPTRVSSPNDVNRSCLTNDSGLSSLSHQTSTDEDLQKSPAVSCDLIITTNNKLISDSDNSFSPSEKLSINDTKQFRHDKATARDLENNNTLIQEDKLNPGVYSRIGDFGFADEQNFTPESRFCTPGYETKDGFIRVTPKPDAVQGVNAHVPVSTDDTCPMHDFQESDLPHPPHYEHNSVNSFRATMLPISNGYCSKEVFCDPP